MHTVNYVDLKGCNGIDSSVISEVSQGRDGIKIKLPDKMKALDWLANHMDLLDTATKEKLKIEKDKLDLEKAKANMGIDDDDETGVVLLPDIDYSLEGGEQDADSSKEKDS
jgi:phage terminase small subunit